MRRWSPIEQALYLLLQLAKSSKSVLEMESFTKLGSSVRTVSQGYLRKAETPEIPPVPVADEAQLPVLFNVKIDRDLVDGVVSWWRGSPSPDAPQLPVLRRPLRPAEREALEARRAELQRATAPCGDADKRRLTAAIVRMLGAFPQVSGRADVPLVEMATSYLWTVRESPPWAIAKACEMVRAGTAGLNRDFCPSEPAFAAIVRPLSAKYAALLGAIQSVLHAPDPEPVREATMGQWQIPHSPMKPEEPEAGYASRVLEQVAARPKIGNWNTDEAAL